MNRSQSDRIIDYLASGQSLTPLAALKRFGCFRLAARIADLKRAGHRITTKMQWRGEKRFASYRLS